VWRDAAREWAPLNLCVHFEFDASLKFQLSQIARNNFRCKLANDLPACRNCDKKAARAGRPCDAKGGARQPAKATPFAGGNEADGLKKAPRRLFSN
jgi:hypothetical protein